MRHIPAGGRWPGGTLSFALPRPRPCALAGPAAAANTAIVSNTLEVFISAPPEVPTQHGLGTHDRAGLVPTDPRARESENDYGASTCTDEVASGSAVGCPAGRTIRRSSARHLVTPEDAHRSESRSLRHNSPTLAA